MFGAMFGGGYRNPQTRFVRFGLLFAVLIAGVVFRHSGGTYDVIRGVYLVAILGLVLYSTARRSGRVGRAGSRVGGPGTPFGGSVSRPGWPSGPIDVRPRGASPDPVPTLGNVGWYPDPTDSGIERYWDGSNWAGTRHRDGSGSLPS